MKTRVAFSLILAILFIINVQSYAEKEPTKSLDDAIVRLKMNSNEVITAKKLLTDHPTLDFSKAVRRSTGEIAIPFKGLLPGDSCCTSDWSVNNQNGGGCRPCANPWGFVMQCRDCYYCPPRPANPCIDNTVD